MATNYFDRFDAPSTNGAPNYFDRFDGAPAPSGGSVPRDPRQNTGSFMDTLRRARSRAQEGVASLAAGIDTVGRDVSNTLGLGGAANWFGNDLGIAKGHMAEAQQDLASTPGVDFDTLKANPSIGNIAKFGIERGLGMIPDIALATNPLGLPAYAVGIEGDVARRRAENDKRGEDPSIMDYIVAAPMTAANVALQKFGVGGSGKLLSAVPREALAQGAISGGDYVATTAGTQQPFSYGDLGAQAAEGAAVGALFGVGRSGVERARDFAVRRAPTENFFDRFDNTPEADFTEAPLEPEFADPRTVDLGERPTNMPDESAAPPPRQRPQAATGVPSDIVDFFVSRGYRPDQARGIAAGIQAESGGNHTAVNPDSGALGLGQWLGSRKDAITKRYGPNPTRLQQLEFIDYELRGGDPGGKAVLSARGEGRVLDAYIRKFMRPAAGAETAGDLQRGSDALGGVDIPTGGEGDSFRSSVDGGDTAGSGGVPYIAPEMLQRINGGFADSGPPRTGATDRLAAMEVRETPSVASRPGDVSAGREPPAQSEIQPSRPEIQAVSREPVVGSDERVITPRGREVGTKFKVYEANDLISSDRNGYLSDLQPRDRSDRAASDAQVAEIASRLDPEQLHSARLASQGAPIIGPDRMVESGNGRTMALRRMYELHPDRADAYRQMIERKGLSTEGFKQPILVRERTDAMTPEDRLAFVREANDRDTMAMSATEQAMSDAKQLSDEALDLYRGGDVDLGRNRDFVMRVLKDAVPTSEHNRMVDGEGRMSQDAVRRVNGMLLAKAYDNPDLVAKVTESSDNDIRTIGGALTDVAGNWAKMRSAAKRGEIPPAHDATAALNEAVAVVQRARSEGQKVGDVLAQGDIFSGRSMSPEAEGFLRLMYDRDLKRPIGRERLADALRFYSDQAMKSSPDSDLLGQEPTKPLEILGRAKDRQDGKRPEEQGEFLNAARAAESTGGGAPEAGRNVEDIDGSQLPRADGEPAGRKSARDLFTDESGSLDPDAYKRLADTVIDVDGLARDAKRIKEAIGDPRSTARAFTKPMQKMVSAVFFTNDAKVRTLAGHFDSPALREYADLWFARPGADDATAPTYHEAVERESTTRAQRAFNALADFMENPAALRRIHDLLRTPKAPVRATAAERKAAEQLRDLLKDTIEYRKAAGEDIGEVTDGYFPRDLDPRLVAKNGERFLRNASEVYLREGLAKDATEARSMAESWQRNIMLEYSGLDGGLQIPRPSSPGTTSGKAREFGKAADELLKDFYNPDPFHTLMNYFGGAARRAEYARRFGMKGAVGSAERKAWIAEHGERSQWDVLQDRIVDDVLASGEETDGIMHTVRAVHASNLGQLGSLDPRIRAATSYLHAWNQLAKMDRTMITSLGELSMGFVRGGPRYGFSYLKDAGAEFVRQIRGAHPSDAARWAEAVGVANDAMVNQALLSRISAEAVNANVRHVMANYYKATLLHQFTEAERIAAVKMGRKMLDVFARDITSATPRVRQRATFYLKELGVKDPEAFAKRMRDRPFTPDEVLANKGDAATYGNALLRLTNQTVMMPSRAEKPTWANHPVGSLFFSLMGYNVALKKNVVDRAARMARQGAKDRDIQLLYPAAMLPMMFVFQGLNDTYLRPFLFGSSYDFSKESPTEAILRIADRAGFTGVLSPVVNALKAVRYRRSLAESLSGPVIGTIADTANKFATLYTDENSPNTNTAERNAAAALYESVIEPGLDAIASARLKGVARTAAVMATGNKKGGALPGDESKFVDAVAGPKEPSFEVGDKQ